MDSELTVGFLFSIGCNDALNMFLMPPFFLVVYLDGGGQLVGGLPRDFVPVFFSLSILFKSPLRRGLLHNAEEGSRGERKSSGEIDWVDL